MTTLCPKRSRASFGDFSKVKITPFLPLLVRRSDLDRKSEPHQTGNLDALLGPEEAVLIFILGRPREMRAAPRSKCDLSGA